MIINYRNKYLRADLIFGILYLVLGLTGFFYGSNGFIKYGFTAIGLLYLFQYFYKVKYSYLKIEGNILFLNIIFQQKKIDLSKVTRIKKFADEITFLTPHEKLKISTKLIAREDLLNLQNLLASLDLEPQKNPFKKEILEIT